MARAIRSASKRTGITIRTRTGTAIYPENSPQLYVPFGADNIAAGSGSTLLTGPATGKTWIIVSLFVSTDAINGAGLRVQFTGSLAALFQSFGGGAVSPEQLIIAPFAIGNVAFACTSTAVAGACHYSVAGSAYQATIPAGSANAQQGQLITIAQDGNPATNLG
jgi:hypothetical protein